MGMMFEVNFMLQGFLNPSTMWVAMIVSWTAGSVFSLRSIVKRASDWMVTTLSNS